MCIEMGMKEGRKKPPLQIGKRVCMYLSKAFDVEVWNP
jgi:hypothetical protein